MAISKIKKNALIEKRNVLNEMRSNSMTLQEMRFLSIYLSKINARDPSTRVVRFTLIDFRRIMDLTRIQAKDIKRTVESLLAKVVHVPTETGGFLSFQLFKRCRVDQDEEGVCYVEIDANDDALPLMFEFKNRYFSYQLWNALRLRSVNQLRMYEILKQYEYIGERTLSMDELRSLLGIQPTEYTRWSNFKMRVLDSCRKALAENTDIRYTYETMTTGRGGRVTSVKFLIEKNETYVDPLSLDKFIARQDVDEDTAKEAKYEPHLLLIAEACECEYTNAQMQVIFDMLRPMRDDLERYDLIKAQYDKMKMYAEQKDIKNQFAYFKKLVVQAVEM